MSMTSRERLLTALDNGRPDRMPCQVHGWMTYYLNHYLDGADWYQANDRFGLDHAIYVPPTYLYDPADEARWQVDRSELPADADGNHRWEVTITTPDGPLHFAGAYNEITGWETEHLVKTREDFELWERYWPRPVGVDVSALTTAREKLGDRGIVRTFPYYWGQGSPWQCLCTLVGTEPAIYWAMDEPDFVADALERIVQRSLAVTAMQKDTPADMVELGGGAGSSTVISPAMFERFCLPYDRRQVDAWHAIGVKTVYHLCGGLMPMLDHVAAMGSDGLETMTPPGMGADCDLAESSRRVGDKLFFIGGFDQSAGFESGTPETARRLVRECFEATKDHAGYICAPSDHFFRGDPANLQAFVDECRACVYD